MCSDSLGGGTGKQGLGLCGFVGTLTLGHLQALTWMPQLCLLPLEILLLDTHTKL